MKGFVQNIEDLAVENKDFRRVLYTAKNCQLVLMALKPQEEIGAEVHKLDQFFRVRSAAEEAEVASAVEFGVGGEHEPADLGVGAPYRQCRCATAR